MYRSLFVMQELARHTISFYFEEIYWQGSWCHKGFKCLAYRQLSANSMVVTRILFTHTTFPWATCCLICFITIVKPFLTLILTTVHTVYIIWKKGLRRVWSIDSGCLLLHGTWSHLWCIRWSMYAHFLICFSYRTYEIECCSSFLSFHFLMNETCTFPFTVLSFRGLSSFKFHWNYPSVLEKNIK
jgi:hypothetical protein